MMKYKGYTGVLEVDEEAEILFGEVVGLRDIITFQGRTVEEARKSFHESVDFYLQICASRNEPPEKPFSGKFLIRISSDLHRTLVEEASRRGVSLNGLIEATLSGAFPVPEAPRAARRSKATETDAATSKRRPAAAKKSETETISASG